MNTYPTTEIVLIANDIRSTHNVGSMLRTAEGFGVSTVFLTGYTPYPFHKGDVRLPHLSEKINHQIAKTALGAERTIAWHYVESVFDCIASVQKAGFTLAALEQSISSVPLTDYRPPKKIVLIVGNEINGVDPTILNTCDVTLEIPMLGRKESFNVAIAAAIALYHLRYR